MRYKCLIFDHDDTVVNSTATVHHPCFQTFLNEYRPGMSISLEDYFIKNFHPGFVQMCREDFNLSDEEMDAELEHWKAYTKLRIPQAYKGMREIMTEQKSSGGIICVVSHSFKENILRDYKANALPEPDAVYGWEQPPERRKPNIWPIEDIMERFSLKASELLMIDDLKPGYDMAKSAGVDFAGAGWAYDVPEIEGFMQDNCGLYFKKVSQLADYIK